MRAALQDLKFALRTLKKSPGYVIAALVVMALGIGANTSLFTVVNAVLLRALPFGHPEQLVVLWHTPPQSSFPGVKIFPLSAANYLDWEKQNTVFTQMAVSSYRTMNLTGNGEPLSLPDEAVSKNYFSTLEALPMLGRTFVPEEDADGKNKSVILSYPLWKDTFGGDPKIVGKQITLNNQAYDVVGVMGPEFRYPSFARIWTPLGMTPKEAVVRGEHHYRVIARLKPGVSLHQAQADLSTIAKQLEQQYPADDKGWGAAVVPLREQMVGDVRPTLLVLLGAVVFVLLIACANVANLTLVRTLGRSKEMAIRTALGAGRNRIIQQVLAESMLLAIAGGAIGVALSQFGTKLITNVLADQLPRTFQVHMDVTVLFFTLGLVLLTGLAAGFVPAWKATHSNPNDALKQGLGRTDSDGGGKTRNVLVVVEVALSLVLLFGAGLMIRTLWALHAVNAGFDPENALSMSVIVGPNKLPNEVAQAQYYQRIVERLRAMPGVQNAGTVDSLPTQGGSMQPVGLEGHPVVAMADQPEVNVRMVSPGYLATMRIPLLQGRMIADADNEHTHPVAIISQAMAKRFWPGQDVIGKHLTLTFQGDTQLEIVGLVGDVRQSGLDSNEDDATVYYPSAQLIFPPAYTWHSFPLSLVVRTAGNPEAMQPAILAAIHEIDSEVPVTEVMTLNQVLGESIAQQRFTMILLEAFAGLALLLAAVGIYSVLAYSVRRRMRDIGIRMALGALPSQVLRMVVMEGMRPTIIGVVIGLASAMAIGRLLKSVVFGVKTTDFATFVAVSVVLLFIAVMASLLPGYRAMKVEPMKTLREE
ncbi:ABC efflux pump, inner membrane subunit [Candidatus Koribacter versatilis Ellin345]|uniref:ABC efflux pump, inner membrane subunit n=1 Tax=Koribacter versatilis (strain Ellin345) TaxID=204669 RepID=Q1IUZ8_KORVE|nr:ABC transporter permease [Candidatus Koribacter versatilis]ABF39302.1 ABC efflux pump, inner membrane subunit [Candidatus Koribacter versatilis Ellin345]